MNSEKQHQQTQRKQRKQQKQQEEEEFYSMGGCWGQPPIKIKKKRT
jgi:hypothetical protein